MPASGFSRFLPEKNCWKIRATRQAGQKAGSSSRAQRQNLASTMPRPRVHSRRDLKQANPQNKRTRRGKTGEEKSLWLCRACTQSQRQKMSSRILVRLPASTSGLHQERPDVPEKGKQPLPTGKRNGNAGRNVRTRPGRVPRDDQDAQWKSASWPFPAWFSRRGSPRRTP